MPLLTESGQPISAVALGCAHFGSFNNTLGRTDLEALVAAALAAGINTFDTADIYGQGDSEHILAGALDACRAQSFVVTKVGQQFSRAMRVLRPIKPVVRRAMRALGRSQSVSRGRQGQMQQDFSPPHLREALRASIGRLRGVAPDLLLLHSPPAATAAEPMIAACFVDLQRQGLCRYIGVSCDDLATLEAALRWRRIDAVQIPIDVWATVRDGPLALVLAGRGISVFVRGVVSQSPERPALEAIAAAVAEPGISSTIVGTLKAAHVRPLAAFTRAELSCDREALVT